MVSLMFRLYQIKYISYHLILTPPPKMALKTLTQKLLHLLLITYADSPHENSPIAFPGQTKYCDAPGILTNDTYAASTVD